MNLLVLGPGDTDPANSVLMVIGKAVLTSAHGDGDEPVQLWGPSRSQVDEHLLANPDVMYFGHGDDSTLGYEEALIDNENVGGARDRIVLAMACSSAEKLGPFAVDQSKVAAYLGFTADVVVPYGPTRHWLLEPWCVSGTVLLEGGTAEDAAKQQRAAFVAEADRIKGLNDGTRGSRTIQMQALRGYAFSFVCTGKADARLA